VRATGEKTAMEPEERRTRVARPPKEMRPARVKGRERVVMLGVRRRMTRTEEGVAGMSFEEDLEVEEVFWVVIVTGLVGVNVR